jgi:CRISPR-associated protein Cas2
MRAKKNFVVVAYDISDNLRRSRVLRLLEKLGSRINYSVFECMITDNQFCKLQHDMEKIINKKEDIVAYYSICVKCYSKTNYQPFQKRMFEKVFVA